MSSRPLVLRHLALIVFLAATLLAPELARAQTVVKPWFLLILDTSGSMTASTGTGNNSCGTARNRMNDAECATQRIVAGTGDAVFGLAQFQQPCSTSCSGGTGTCDATFASATLRVPIVDDNAPTIISWVDNVCSGDCTPASDILEMWASGNTPLEGSLRRARRYFDGSEAAPFTSPIVPDDYAGCRPVSVILLTDGAETCGGTPASGATALRTTPVTLDRGRGVISANIRTYVIGFGIAAGNAQIEGIALAGGTDAPGTHRGFYATDETTLSLALSQIIADSALVEICDGMDNNCNMLVDEGFPKFCNRPTIHPAQDLCVDPGETLCDGIDNNCDGRIDEGLLNACGTCGATPAEVCDGFDNDCDGIIDEGMVCGTCVFATERCDGVDNDCDVLIDEGITRPCGTDTGECTAGTEPCIAGVYNTTMCSATGPSPEICDGLDNDCDGVTDGFSRPCGSAVGACVPGIEVCVAGVFGMCLGAVGPTTEVCDTFDNDCDGMTDESDPDLGTMCGDDTGECMGGTIICVAGVLTCDGAIGPGTEICDGLDNDCDGTPDDGLGVGEACGVDAGECEPGINVCVGGAVVCMGEIPGTPETCNNLDDDCNGITDDGIEDGGPCGSDVGECMEGRLRCIMGADVCEGKIPGSPELCDCLDNDCDGTIDEDPMTGPICGAAGPGGAASCLTGPDCQCALPCIPTEFGGFTCPSGRAPVVTSPTVCFCVAERCDGVSCAGQTVMSGGATVCAPSSTDVAPCVCRNNECTDACTGVVCTPPTVCAPRGRDVGRCVEDNCRGLGCDAGEICDVGTGACEADPCVGVTCAPTEACRAGTCEASCAAVTCMSGESCRAGRCVPDACGGVSCRTGERCNPATGMCTADPCLDVRCASSFVCDATGMCVPDPCIGLTCPMGQMCEDGECVRREVDAGVDGGGFDAGPNATAGGTRVLATGGGGCACDVGAGATTTTTPGWLPPFLALAGLGIVAWRRRRRARTARLPFAGSRVRGAHAAVGVLAAGILLAASGCKVDPYCIDCVPRDAGLRDANGATGDGGGREGGTSDDAGASGGDGAIGDAGPVDAAPDGCVPGAVEFCNGIDDNCNGSVDEGIDTMTDETNCGSCGHRCSDTILGAFPECTAGVCGYTTCDVGYIDFDGDPTNGCELRCTPTAADDTLCDRRDNDCDMLIDEDVAFMTDPANCGICGRSCVVAHATAACVAGACTVSACDPGFVDLDGMGATGCEYRCTPGAPPTEICNRRDDDCNGMTDEGDPGGGTACGVDTGECVAGVEHCVGGRIVCMGSTGPAAEVCDGLDNNCEGRVDEGFLTTDINNCGMCGRRCMFTNAFPACVAGACVITACMPGFVDFNMDPTDGCEFACTFTGSEVCNGRDDDCNMVVDDALTPPATFCNANGVCAGTIPTCGGASGWQCTYPATHEDTETRCDALDNDCDGSVDEPFPTVGNSCSNGTGACRRTGMIVCTAAGTGVVCNAPAAGATANEICDNLDNDCDGFTDERAIVVDTDPRYVVEPMVMVSASLYVYQFEASRPDATAMAQGSLSTRACSRTGVLPWTTVTYPQADAACTAAGMRLCTETEWQQACRSSTTTCNWGSVSCTTYSTATPQCNTNEFDPVAGAPDDDLLRTTESMPMCYSSWGAAATNRIFDMTGNVKEWTRDAATSPTNNPIRGGSYNNIREGSRCDFNFTRANNTFQFANVGFRCCSSTAP